MIFICATVSDFDNFHLDRSSASERLANLPTVPGATAGANAANNRRHLDKDDDNALFAL